MVARGDRGSRRQGRRQASCALVSQSALLARAGRRAAGGPHVWLWQGRTAVCWTRLGVGGQTDGDGVCVCECVCMCREERVNCVPDSGAR